MRSSCHSTHRVSFPTNRFSFHGRFLWTGIQTGLAVGKPQNLEQAALPTGRFCTEFQKFHPSAEGTLRKNVRNGILFVAGAIEIKTRKSA